MPPLRPALLAVLLCCSGGCKSSAPSAEAADLQRSFPVAPPSIEDVVVRREYVAKIEAVRYAELHARLKGTLEAVAVDEGQRVTAGQLLFSIDARARKQDVVVAQAATHAEQAELDAAQLDLENTRRLAEKNIVSDAELERAKSKAAMSRAKVEQARALAQRAAVELDRADIRAPFDGVVDRIPRKAGNMVTEDELLTTISDSHEVFAYFSISEHEYLDFVRASGARPRQVSLVLADGSTFAQPGQVDAVAGELDPETGTLAYRARFPNPDGLLKHGSSGKVVIEHPIKGAIVVPQSQTFEVQGSVFVFVVDDKHVVHLRKLDVQQRIDDKFVVRGGVTAKDQLLVEGLQLVKDGMVIEPRTPDRVR